MEKIETTTVLFGDFFSQLSELEIDFVITHLNRSKKLGFETSRAHVATLDAKFIKSFVNELNVGTIGQIIVQSLNNRMAV
jgi:hypothetical protein